MKVRNIATSMVAGIATLASASALAFDFDGVYLLGGVGVAGIEDGEFNRDRATLEARTDFAWRGGLGAWMTDNIGMEFNYIGLKGSDDTKANSTPYYEIEVSPASFFDLSGIGRCYIADQFWVFGRAGVAIAHTKREVVTDLGREELNDPTGMGAAIGVGAQYDFSPMVGVRLEASTVQALNDNDMYAVTGNIVLNFGEFM